MSTFDDWIARIEAEHLAEVERGEHDDACESRPHSRLCHCAKRRREATGFTTLADMAEVIWQAPSCPRCYGDLSHDGDGWSCDDCSVSWNNDGTGPMFTDDYGDLSQGPISAEMQSTPRSAARPIVDAEPVGGVL